MIPQNTFSFFKNKSPRYDWGVALITGGVLLGVSFIAAWQLLRITQENVQSTDITITETVMLDDERLKRAEEQFTKREDVLTEILLEYSGSAVSGTEEVQEGIEEVEAEGA